MKDASAEFHPDRIDPAAWAFVRDRLSYLQGDFEKPDLFRALAERLKGNVVFYLAVPRFFGPIVDSLGAAGLLKRRRRLSPRRDREAVRQRPRLGAGAQRQHPEGGRRAQVYRIDHFLGKDTVQSILAVRFANALFEPVWRREYIDHVQITAAETIGVEGRGALLRADRRVSRHGAEPSVPVARHDRDGAAQFVRRRSRARQEGRDLRRDPADRSARDVVLGQYEAGRCRPGRQGLSAGAGRRADSRTETYAAARVYIDNWRWAGVPFYLRTGKRLAARRTEIAVQLKPVPFALFRERPSIADAERAARCGSSAVTARLRFNVKVPGAGDAGRARVRRFRLRRFLRGAAERRL